MSGALKGLKILDFTTLLPGPYATMCLADMGAEVVMIASGSRTEVGESRPPFVPGTDLSSSRAYLGRNKRCMTLNLKDPRGLEIIHKLITKHDFDIVIEQFRPGVMGRLKLDYESLKAIKPDIIYCSLTGYGQDGPMITRAGHDINYIARSGIVSYSGRKGQGPSLMGMQIADLASGSYNSIIGILAAVISRNATGKGQFIDISMTDGMIAFNAFLGAGALIDGKDLEPEGTFTTGGGFYDFYETKEGKYISVGSLEPKFFANFCQTINRPDLIPGGVAPKDIAGSKEEVREIIRTKTREEWIALFNATDACVEPVMTLTEVFEDEMTKEREMIVEVPLISGQTVRQIANPIKFSETKQVYKSVGVKPTSGGHRSEILRELGYTESEIEAFAKTGLFD
jgi:crotonobetainyl-CoA:carnitine CoA-transferase CaiB-like acyl-CoA transferase